MESDATLMGLAVDVLTTADPTEKVARSLAAAKRWAEGGLARGDATPPARPARPARPELLPPGAMPKRSTGPKGRIALIHALAHIEFNAIDLAWDIIARFGSDMPRAFLDDWVSVAEEEAQHFALLKARLEAWNVAYGDLAAHDGLWEAAMATADDLAARLVIVPMTLEARGLDVTPQTAARFRAAGDDETADVLERIYRDEIKHLRAGVRWFETLCARDDRAPHAVFREIVETRFVGTPKGPFNLPARATAGMNADYLKPWM
jgi:uncharacterized ferritin-like protein (DUF455 family)